MPITIDLETHPFASKFFLKGRSKGKAEGKADTLLRQLARRFKTLPAGVEERIRAAGMDQLDEWIDRFVDANALEDVFGGDPKH